MEFSTTSSASHIPFSELPEDLQVLIWQFLEETSFDGDVLPSLLLPVQWVALECFPEVAIHPPLDFLSEEDLRQWNGDERDEQYAAIFIGTSEVPPLLICADAWLDGRHRLWAARKAGLSSVPVIDLAPLLQPADWQLLASICMDRLSPV